MKESAPFSPYYLPKHKNQCPSSHSLPLQIQKNELLSGLTVALALVPEAVAFALVAQLHPLFGLYAAFIIGIITSVFGGRPGMISGATGAIAVVLVSLVVTHGAEYLLAAVVLMGVLQMLFGMLQLGKFIRLRATPGVSRFCKRAGAGDLSSTTQTVPDYRRRWYKQLDYGHATYLDAGSHRYHDGDYSVSTPPDQSSTGHIGRYCSSEFGRIFIWY